ncbi:MAG: glycosyltransferase [Acidobacteria bacterium]|nr:glycosyltransferase [Acidobacteriota bacterium]
MNIAVLGIRIPTPDLDAGSLRMIHLLELLQESSEHVYYVPCRPFHNDPYGKRLVKDILALQESDIVVLPAPDQPGKNPLIIAERPDMVIFSDEWVAHHYLKAVHSHFPDAMIVFDTVDLHHIRLYREAKLTKNRKLATLAVQARHRELDAVTHADVTLVVSVEEARILKHSHPQADIQILPTIHTVSNRPTPHFGERTGLLFVGSFNHTPNVDAIQVLMETLLPEIWEQLPGLPITIVGANPPEPWASHPLKGVCFTDFVPDLLSFYDKARLFVAPLRFGAGVKGKVLDSMAHGLPVAGTPIAAEGLGVTDSIHMTIGKTDTDFVQKLVAAYTDENLWTRMHNNGRSLVTENFSWEQARGIVQYLVKRSLEQ